MRNYDIDHAAGRENFSGYNIEPGSFEGDGHASGFINGAGTLDMDCRCDSVEYMYDDRHLSPFIDDTFGYANGLADGYGEETYQGTGFIRI